VKTLTEWQSKLALGPDLPRPREALTRSAAEARDFADGLGVPVVMKASGLPHKSDQGGVRVGVLGIEVPLHWDQLAALGDGTVLIAEQVRGELELILGGIRDKQFGPVLSIGIGGIAAEVEADVSFLLAPPAPGELEKAISRLRGALLLNGHRGRRVVDRSGLSAILDAIGRLLIEDERVLEVDCNPVIVSQGRPVVVDALVVRRR
jgi:hypothetical protein